MIKQLLLNREVSRIRKLYPDILKKFDDYTPTKNLKSNGSSIIKEEEISVGDENEYFSSKFNSNEKLEKNWNVYENKNIIPQQQSKVKNVCLDLKEILKECKKN